MQLVRQMSLFACALATLLIAVDAAAVPNKGNSQFAHDSQNKDKKDKEYFSANRPRRPHTTPVSVPEPATIALLGAGAGLAGVYKLWQDRRRTKRVSAE